MSATFSAIPLGRLRQVAVPLSVLYLLALIPFRLVGDAGAMVRLQLAGSETKAREIVAGWSESEAVDMAYLQGLDALHPVVYGLLLALAAVWAGRLSSGSFAHWSRIAIGAAVAAAVLDTIENVGMIVMIRGEVGSPIPTITTSFAIAKFLLIISVLVYVATAGAAHLSGKNDRSVSRTEERGA